ncbi:preprotein translocase subunit SecD [Peptoclostridium litorale DSM 5388]|uniref:Protein translocase subunit SecD n=1 Tax=Peptoclostridium litorale DSM 5388 TaxID=1121324 RepID=A0A069RH35_PEPLI|nr:protein translocase subunit SecD [Peptoclostridium litorale]KDR96088.1 protein translocase subunit SecD [Peptoclostridium litorale DSM 5388]SIO04940.1 preprotein translocase subunit SecD [Peptoclostridium litorale DSM 5388]
MKIKSKGIAVFLSIIIIISAALYTAVSGLNMGGISIAPMKDGIKQGLDLKGGVYVVYEAQTDETGEELKKIIDQTIEVFRRRIDSLGLTEPVIVKEGEKRIRIELPGVKNAREAIDMVGKTAQLKFILEDGSVVVTGKNVKDSEVVFRNDSNEPIVSLKFDAEGAKAFADATEKLAPTRSPILIVLDNQVISSPRVNDKIPNGEATISGNFTVESASELANLIRAGALPVDFKEIQTSTITATLGENALKASVQGAKIGVVILVLFMLLYYRIPGFVACIALVAYALIIGFTFVIMGATLTLPGIAALILSVGMAVDANVIVFERIKEEIRNGKSIRASIDSGFSKALSTIVDGNITTFIAGVVLYNFGTGPIKGFAVMLMIGIIASMFTAVVISKALLKSISNANVVKNTKMFGA